MPRVRRPRRPATREHYAALAARLTPNDWSRAGLVARCAQVALALLKQGATPGTLDAWWPGGASNVGATGLGPWVRCYAEFAARAREAPARAVDDAAVQQAILDGITEQPAYVTCADDVVRAVYPKSLAVHFALSALDQHVADAATAPMERVRAIVQWVWIVTTPGHGAPFDLQQPVAQWPAPTGDALAWLDALTAFDLLALVQAYNAVDRHAVALMLSAFPRRPQGDAPRLALAGFFGVIAKDRDLAQHSAKRIIATTLSDVTVQEEARQRATQEAQTTHGTRAAPAARAS